MKTLALSLCSLCSLWFLPVSAAPQHNREGWIWLQSRMTDDAQLAKATNLVERGARSGYTSLVLSGGEDTYWQADRAARVKALAEYAATKNIDIIPAIWGFGYGGTILYARPESVETTPAKGVEYLVSGNFAKAVPHVIETGYEGKTFTSNFLFVSNGKLKPNRTYALSLRVRTEGIDPVKYYTLRGHVLHSDKGWDCEGSTESELYDLPVKSTQDWQEYNWVFNTYDNGEAYVTINLSRKETKAGCCWFDSVKLVEKPISHCIVETPGLEPVVRSASGDAYVAGKDYEPLPKMVSCRAKCSELVIRVLPGGAIKEGETIYLDAHVPAIEGAKQYSTCPSSPVVKAYLRETAKTIEELVHPKRWLFSVDEWRVANRCPLCRARQVSPGRLIGECVAEMAAAVKEVNPKAECCAWADMLCPKENAGRKQYYCVSGSLADSWQYLPRDLIMVPWMNGRSDVTTTRWLMDRGFRCLAGGYYNYSDFSRDIVWRDACRDDPKFLGMMYTTWGGGWGDGGYDRLEAYGEMLQTGKRVKRSEAFDELVRHLRLVTGREPARGDDGTLALDGYRFVFKAPEDAEPLRPFESRYRIDGKTVYLWGDNGGDSKLWNWGDNRSPEVMNRKGTLFAVETFAGNELGIRWLWPGEDGVEFESVAELKFPERKEGSFTTAMQMTRLRNYGHYEGDARVVGELAFTPPGLKLDPLVYRRVSHDDRAEWLPRMRHQNRAFFRYGHAFTDWKQKYFKDRPELFNYRAADGSRGWTGTQGDDRTKRCVSNEDNVDLIIANWCAAGTNEFLNVCENDSGFYCECDACNALDVPQEGVSRYGFVTDRYVNFWNRIAKKAVAIRKDVKLVTYAYSNYRLPPKRERIEYPDNMLFGFVPSIMDDAIEGLRAWQAVGMKHFFLRPNFHHYSGTIPRGFERVMYEIFRQCLELGMIGVDYDAGARNQVMDLEYYVTARQMADPTLPFETLCEEFYAGYGAAKEDVKRYFEAVRREGERARLEYIALGNRRAEVLDDSQLSAMQCFGRNEEELRASAMILHEAVAKWKGKLAPKYLDRLERLAERARHAVMTYRFLTQQKAAPEVFAKRGRELIEYRLAHRDLLDCCWSSIFGNWYGEIRIWRKQPEFLICFADGGELDPEGETKYWSANFESGIFTKWRRDGKVAEVRRGLASKGEWAVWLPADVRSGTENDNVRVVPGAKYRVTYDVYRTEGADGVNIRAVQYAVPEKGLKQTTLVSEYFRELPVGKWTEIAMEFTAPTDFPESRKDVLHENVRTAIHTLGQGAEGSAVYVDNIRVQRIQ